MKSKKVGHSYCLGWAKRIKAIKMLGGKCSRCGNKDIFVLDFHHLYGKDSSVSQLKWSRWSLFEREFKKCILLCGNCHSELHYKEGRTGQFKNDIILSLSMEPKCKRCGYVGENLKSLCFHHREDKKFDISNALARKISGCSVQDIFDEIKKCDILCRNCHILEHTDKEKFKKMESEIYAKVEGHKELVRLDYSEIKKMKENGLSITEIAKITGRNKSSVHYVFHKNL